MGSPDAYQSVTDSPGRVGNAFGEGFQESSVQGGGVDQVHGQHMMDVQAIPMHRAYPGAIYHTGFRQQGHGKSRIYSSAYIVQIRAGDDRVVWNPRLFQIPKTQVPENTVGIEQGEIRPLVAKTYPLADIVRAQQDFMAKGFAGKLVLLPGSSGR